LYANDILLYKPVSHTLITHLIANWIKDNYLTNKTSKTKSMTMSRSRTCPF